MAKNTKNTNEQAPLMPQAQIMDKSSPGCLSHIPEKDRTATKFAGGCAAGGAVLFAGGATLFGVFGAGSCLGYTGFSAATAGAGATIGGGVALCKIGFFDKALQKIGLCANSDENANTNYCSPNNPFRPSHN